MSIHPLTGIVGVRRRDIASQSIHVASGYSAGPQLRELKATSLPEPVLRGNLWKIRSGGFGFVRNRTAIAECDHGFAA
jgi:hypothetical protein